MILSSTRFYKTRSLFLQIPNLFNMTDFRFAGHETFHCRQQWLYKGLNHFIRTSKYDTAPNDETIIRLGVGANMVKSISHWLKAYNIIDANSKEFRMTPEAKVIFGGTTINGLDQYLEDEGTLWLLHYMLCSTKFASIYHLIFGDYVLEKATNTFTEDRILRFLTKQHNNTSKLNLNTNTLKSDIKVFLNTYFVDVKSNVKSLDDDYNAPLVALGIISRLENDDSEKTYVINRGIHLNIPTPIIAYCILKYSDENNKRNISFDEYSQNIGVYFTLTIEGAELALERVTKKFPHFINYSNNAGIKEIQIKDGIDTISILEGYYND